MTRDGHIRDFPTLDLPALCVQFDWSVEKGEFTVS